MTVTTELTLAHGLDFVDLYRAGGVARIDGLFRDYLAAGDVDLSRRLREARAQPGALEAKTQRDIWLDITPRPQCQNADVHNVFLYRK